MTAVFVMMGVSGCGKTTVGEALAQKLRTQFYDGDDFHPPENVAKMSKGVPLNDDDRRPWLQRNKVKSRPLVLSMIVTMRLFLSLSGCVCETNSWPKT
jgi:gluconokinase